MFIGSIKKLAFSSLGIFAIACDPDVPNPHYPPTATRDSAGVNIVENGPHGWVEHVPWTITGPTLSIGEIDGPEDYQFYGVTGALLLGRKIVVANGGTQQLRNYDMEGVLIGSSGRQGQGPGEFARMGNLSRYRGDSLLVAEKMDNRFSIFSADGVLGRSGRLRQAGGEMPFSTVTGSTANGNFLVRSYDPTGAANAPASGVITAFVELISQVPDGDSGKSIGRFHGFQMYRGRSPMAFGPIPFGSQTVQAAFGNLIYVGESGSYEIKVFSTEGALLRIIRKEHAPIAIGATYRARDIEQRRRELSRLPDVLRAAQESVLEEIPFPEFFPAFRDIVLDSEGNLWVGNFSLPGAVERSYLVFDTSGLLLGPVDFPPSFTPFDIGSDYVLGRYRDEQGVEYIHLYELQKGGRKATQHLSLVPAAGVDPTGTGTCYSQVPQVRPPAFSPQGQSVAC